MPSHAETLKPRMVVLTDVSTWETDDSESLVRLMVHADLLEIEGLVFTTGWSLDKTRDEFMELMKKVEDSGKLTITITPITMLKISNLLV